MTKITERGKNDITAWLPVSREEASLREWDEFDVILFTGDAYIDHPSFAAAVIGRVVEAEGYRIGIVPQPNWRDDLRDFRKLGRPGLFFAVSAGNMDSMVNHYTAMKRLRSDDAYTPGGRAGHRPDYPTVVYSEILKSIYPDVPVVIGGVEASMRRLAHYDYWKDTVLPSMLVSSGADMLVYGMGEKPLVELLRLLERGIPFDNLINIPQTAVALPAEDKLPAGQKGWRTITLPSFEEVSGSKQKFGEAFAIFERESNRIDAARLVQESGGRRVVVNPHFPPLTTEETDRIYDLPYTRLPHPRYNRKPPVPAYEMIKNSVNIHRGCFGGCSFCAIAAHQGKHISSRSEESVVRELDAIAGMPDFNGVVTDLGGPSANMYRMEGKDRKRCISCTRPSCIWPSICSNLEVSHRSLNNLYRTARERSGIKRVYIGSGVRYDLLLRSFNKNAGSEEDIYLDDMLRYHVQGRFKVAPEHTSPTVLSVMRKPSFTLFSELKKKFDNFNRKEGTRMEIIPYFISSHPGCGIKDMAELAVETRAMGMKLEQVQDFTPTPMTLATTIYYTGTDPYTGKAVEVAHTPEEKRSQNNLFFWYRHEKVSGIRRDLNRAGLAYMLPLITGESPLKGPLKGNLKKRRAQGKLKGNPAQGKLKKGQEKRNLREGPEQANLKKRTDPGIPKDNPDQGHIKKTRNGSDKNRRPPRAKPNTNQK
ncbi:MAG: YgiQ family radical SAM protein [Bacteroidales bacterium]|nr:YgiQ family radical SAM protein [Bacteroidales bacterium]